MENPDFSYSTEKLDNGDWVIAEYHADKWVRHLGMRFSCQDDADRFLTVNMATMAKRHEPTYVYEPYQLPEGNWVVAEYKKGKLSAHLGMAQDSKAEVERLLDYNGWPRRLREGK